MVKSSRDFLFFYLFRFYIELLSHMSQQVVIYPWW